GGDEHPAARAGFDFGAGLDAFGRERVVQVDHLRERGVSPLEERLRRGKLLIQLDEQSLLSLLVTSARKRLYGGFDRLVGALPLVPFADKLLPERGFFRRLRQRLVDFPARIDVGPRGVTRIDGGGEFVLRRVVVLVNRDTDVCGFDGGLPL